MMNPLREYMLIHEFKSLARKGQIEIDDDDCDQAIEVAAEYQSFKSQLQAVRSLMKKRCRTNKYPRTPKGRVRVRL